MIHRTVRAGLRRTIAVLGLLGPSLLVLVPSTTDAVASPPAPTGEAAAEAVVEAPAVAEPRPTPVVERLHAAILVSMKGADEMGYRGRYDNLEPVMTETFDLDYMARKSVGRGWKELSNEDRQLWMGTFARMIVANYAGQFNGYDGEYFETLGEEPSIKGTVLVRTRIVVPSDDDFVELNYRTRNSGQGWRIIDVYMNGTVSELALRRSEYTEVLKTKGFDKLVALLNDKVEKLAESE